MATFKTQHKTIKVENKFTTGSHQTGGRFEFEFPDIGFEHDYVKVISIAYNDANALATSNPITVSCAQLGGPLGSFFVVDDAKTTPVVTCPGTILSNWNSIRVSGPMEFICTSGSTAVTTLDGLLSIILEFVKKPPRRQRA